MNPNEAARNAAQQRAAMLARLQSVKSEARSRRGELRAKAETLQGEAKDAKQTRELTQSHPLDLFITPKDLAARMVQIANVRPGYSYLEPSAGTGRIADAIRAAGATPECVELNYSLVEHLRKRDYFVHHSDFMTWEPPNLAKYDAVLLNPPFSNGQDADHIQRACGFVIEGGIVVAIAGEGIFYRSDKKAQAFRAWLDAVSGTSDPLPENTFSQSGTQARARLVIIRK